ncbi:hypothetical protein ES705_38256 [subsurface metagenome]
MDRLGRLSRDTYPENHARSPWSIIMPLPKETEVFKYGMYKTCI